MRSEAQNRRVQLMRAKTLHDRLSTLEPDGFVQWAALPNWVRPALDATRPTTAVPDATLPLTGPDVAGWMRDFMELSGLCDRWYVSTGLSLFPWLSVRAVVPDWLEQIVKVRSEEVTLLSGTQDVLVVFYVEEYEFQAFRRSG
ncbi:hypothetical protein DMH04_04700 [Kibdelosporangium aridum]|uniref:Uncharacterized protein n=1 Tax=Kibdelosporangium aridum TaxID=2030 RepID=A0A428ZRR5_KIBAR|nr:hypothetical protein [Kibdelosporangium aridum]RSM90756.1 hypothetical protein DMH04_04700 [Kibdelosporangium aridum]